MTQETTPRCGRRMSDSSLYDERCDVCRQTDRNGPIKCPYPPQEKTTPTASDPRLDELDEMEKLAKAYDKAVGGYFPDCPGSVDDVYAWARDAREAIPALIGMVRDRDAVVATYKASLRARYDRIEYAEARATAAETRVARLQSALEPFAAFADALSEETPDGIAIGIYADGAMQFGPAGGVDVGKLRAARSALGKAET
jgi:hypothetical protein